MKFFLAAILIALTTPLHAMTVKLDFLNGTYSSTTASDIPNLFEHADMRVELTDAPGNFMVGPHMHFGYGAQEMDVTYRNGARFDAVSAWLDPAGSFYYFVTDDYIFNGADPEPCGPLCKDARFTGYRNGAVVADVFTSSSINGSYAFDSTFRDLDLLRVAIEYRFDTDRKTDYFGEPHYYLRDLTIQPVPLGSSAPMLGMVLGGMVLMRRRARG